MKVNVWQGEILKPSTTNSMWIGHLIQSHNRLCSILFILSLFNVVLNKLDYTSSYEKIISEYRIEKVVEWNDRGLI